MASLKSITDLPMAENTGDLNLIVNDNGMAKQINANFLSENSNSNDLIIEQFSGEIYEPTIDDIMPISNEQLNRFFESLNRGEMPKIIYKYYSDQFGWHNRAEYVMAYNVFEKEIRAHQFIVFDVEGLASGVLCILIRDGQLEVSVQPL